MQEAPTRPELLALAGESLADRGAGLDAVQAEMPEVASQLAPGREHIDRDVIDDGDRTDGALRAPGLLVLINEAEFCSSRTARRSSRRSTRGGLVPHAETCSD